MGSVYTFTDSASLWELTLHPPEHKPSGEDSGAEAICLTDDFQVVLIRDSAGRLNTPGALPRDDESSAQTMLRAVGEIIGIAPSVFRLLTYARMEAVEGPATGQTTVRAIYLASIDNVPSTDVIYVSLDGLAAVMEKDWPGLAAFSADLVDRVQQVLPAFSQE